MTLPTSPYNYPTLHQQDSAEKYKACPDKNPEAIVQMKDLWAAQQVLKTTLLPLIAQTVQEMTAIATEKLRLRLDIAEKRLDEPLVMQETFIEILDIEPATPYLTTANTSGKMETLNLDKMLDAMFGLQDSFSPTFREVLPLTAAAPIPFQSGYLHPNPDTIKLLSPVREELLAEENTRLKRRNENQSNSIGNLQKSEAALQSQLETERTKHNKATQTITAKVKEIETLNAALTRLRHENVVTSNSLNTQARNTSEYRSNLYKTQDEITRLKGFIKELEQRELDARKNAELCQARLSEVLAKASAATLDSARLDTLQHLITENGPLKYGPFSKLYANSALTIHPQDTRATSTFSIRTALDHGIRQRFLHFTATRIGGQPQRS